MSSKPHPGSTQTYLALTVTPIRLITCKSLQDPNLTMLHRAKREAPLSHGKVTQGIGEREMEMKECGNVNLSFVKH